MYLISIEKEPPTIEASLGGRIDWLELHTLVEELKERFFSRRNEGYSFILDFSKARAFDHACERLLDEAAAFGEHCGIKLVSVYSNGINALERDRAA